MATAEDIERIVREVMARLGVASQVAAAAPPMPTPPAAPAAAKDEGYIDARVVTMETIAGRLNGTKQLTVAPGALVTPAVRDELRRKGVGLVRGTRTSADKTLPRVLLVAGRTQHSPAAALEVIRQEAIDVESESYDCLIASTDRLAAAAAEGSLGVLWTRHTAAGLCLANRHAGVRAVLAAGVPVTAAAVAAVGANVLVVDPTTGTAYEKKQILREFCLGGIRDCPEALKERLGR